ncbi:MAG: 50S ribosomal protein L9 [Flavobacteriales bacterium]|nr:50S ribosomal protein L9 [Flavobacteriales bacterium]MBG65349.1 50S ribosomal protein L9 [Flavobacteriales bacterium]|tara:strand:+ start:2007 stop:2450 length:444 start_codon:yes stop_codon:yes gene_type:complete
MDVILKENIEKLGFKNEIVSVKNGYARNYLIPKGYAILATKSAIKVLEENLRQQQQKDEKEIEKANKLADSLKSLDVIIKAKVAEGGIKLFGSIKVTQFVQTLSSMGYELDSKFIKLTSIKEIGDYNAEIRLHRNVSISLPFKVIAE